MVSRLVSSTCVSSTCVTPTPPPARTIPTEPARRTLTVVRWEREKEEMEVTGDVPSITTQDEASRASVSLPGEQPPASLSLSQIVVSELGCTEAGLGWAWLGLPVRPSDHTVQLTSPLLSSPPSTDLVLSMEKLNRLTGSCFPNENEFDFNTKHLTGSLVISPCPQQLQERTAGNCFMFYLCVLCALCYLDWKSFIIELLNLIQTLYYVGLRFLLLRTIHQVYPSSLVTTERKMLSYLKENPSLSERILISYEIKPPPTHKGQHIEY